MDAVTKDRNTINTFGGNPDLNNQQCCAVMGMCLFVIQICVKTSDIKKIVLEPDFILLKLALYLCRDILNDTQAWCLFLRRLHV